jgi:excisionase family DNA binding protein
MKISIENRYTLCANDYGSLSRLIRIPEHVRWHGTCFSSPILVSRATETTHTGKQMKVKTPAQDSLRIAVMALQRSVPELSTEALLDAIRRYEPAESGHTPAAGDPGRLLTVRETADRLSCSARTVWTLIAQGRLPRVKLGERTTRISEASVVALAQTAARSEGDQMARTD